ncbi:MULTISPECIES: DUF927 domain-containing protein [unclassified Endozoicomonas]|uniref:DUF927 domain-containing protein n=1 Tax=unclassified Endozoicomonas TaxID=2644528 RepID=UPI0021481B25|nr:MULTISPECIES: DUF927 domain-containing protein [unclassified Endozoicomonas]
MEIKSIFENLEEPVGDGFYIQSGYLYFEPKKTGKEKVPPQSVKISTELRITARTRDVDGRQHGRRMEFHDADGRLRIVCIASSSMQTDGAEVRQLLADLGLEIMPFKQARELLNRYIVMSQPKQAALCLDRLGWCSNFSAYILPDKTIGTTDGEDIVYQPVAPGGHITIRQIGSHVDWKRMSQLCEGNSRLVMAICAAFAAPLVELTGMESGGFNFVGGSSTGKTTALYVAASVYGDQHYLNRWRATGNGLEAMAAAHNNALLILDELAQVSPREAGEIAYMLANGSGKARASVTGGSRTIVRWSLMFLSAGEITLAQHMREGGKKARAGQEVRMVDIPADAGAGMGMFENLHEIESPSRFAEVIRDLSAKAYGHGIVLFLEQVTDHISQDKLGLLDVIREAVDGFIGQVVPASADGQVRRVARRFGLLAAAGELATSVGITGWKEGEAMMAITTCFSAWLNERGGIGSQEEQSILEQVRYFFQCHGDSRFSEINRDANDVNTQPLNRAGFRKKSDENILFLVFPEVFNKEVASGFNPKHVAQICAQAGYLLPDSNGKHSQSRKIPGTDKKARYYIFTALVLGGE